MKIKRLLALVLTFCMMLTVANFPVMAATSGTCGDNLTWILDDNGTLTISGTGAMTNYSSTLSIPWYNIRSSIKKVLVEQGVTTIGKSAFYDCGYLASITIPDSVTEIGDGAFYWCYNLESITIPDSITTIGNFAFWCCDRLTSVTLGGNVTTIGNYAFYGCKSLTSITIPDSVTEIGDGAFYWCESLTSITIPNNVTTIGEEAFSYCLSLKSVTIPDSVTEIGDSAFYYCLSLANVTLGDSVTTIGNYACGDCFSLKSVTISDSVTEMGDGAFSSCSSLADVYYTGTEAQKQQISIGSDNSYLTNATWYYNFCGEGNHNYDNACDAICNECDTAREVDHIYDNNCDTDCNVCGDTREVSDHVYDNVCDTDCNECGKTRVVPDHVYDNVCDTDCNECGKTRVVPDHVYDNEYDADCNECGHTRVVENAPTFVVSNATAKVGNTFTVAVSTKNNIGIVSLKLKVGYDAEVLELVSVEGKDFDSPSFGPLDKNPVTINWEDVLSDNNTTDGAVALLTFKVKDDATAGTTEITITYNPNDVYDYNMDNVEFATENGTINIIEYIPGDVNDDDEVNNKDLGVLRRWLNDWDVTIDELAADVNRDGEVNNKDLGILRRYLNDWDVELK